MDCSDDDKRTIEDNVGKLTKVDQDQLFGKKTALARTYLSCELDDDTKAEYLEAYKEVCALSGGHASPPGGHSASGIDAARS